MWFVSQIASILLHISIAYLECDYSDKGKVRSLQGYRGSGQDRAVEKQEYIWNVVAVDVVSIKKSSTKWQTCFS